MITLLVIVVLLMISYDLRFKNQDRVSNISYAMLDWDFDEQNTQKLDLFSYHLLVF